MTQRKIALSIEEAADYTGIGRNTLRQLVAVSYTHLDVYKRQVYNSRSTKINYSNRTK